MQLVFVSVGAIRRENYHSDNQIPSSSLPPPKWDNAPMVILLQDKHFDELFSFLEIFDRLNVKKESNKSKEDDEIETDFGDGTSACNPENVLQQSQGQHLCQLMWELLCLLPTNPSVYNRLKYFEKFLTSGEDEPCKSDEHSYQEFLVPWSSLLNPLHPHKLLYCLQVVDLIHFSNGEKQKQLSHSSKSSSESSDTSDEESEKSAQTITWGSRFVEFGGLQHLYNTLMFGHLEVGKCGNLWTPWQEECLAYLLKLICEFGTIKSDDDEDEVFSSADADQLMQLFQHRDGKFRVRYKSTDKEETIFIKSLSQVSIHTITYFNE